MFSIFHYVFFLQKTGDINSVIEVSAVHSLKFSRSGLQNLKRATTNLETADVAISFSSRFRSLFLLCTQNRHFFSTATVRYATFGEGAACHLVDCPGKQLHPDLTRVKSAPFFWPRFL